MVFGQWLENVDQAHLVLASGNPVLQKICTEWVCKDFKSYVLGLDDGNLAFADLGGELRGRRAATGAAPDHHQLEAENKDSADS